MDIIINISTTCCYNSLFFENCCEYPHILPTYIPLFAFLLMYHAAAGRLKRNRLVSIPNRIFDFKCKQICSSCQQLSHNLKLQSLSKGNKTQLCTKFQIDRLNLSSGNLSEGRRELVSQIHRELVSQFCIQRAQTSSDH